MTKTRTSWCEADATSLLHLRSWFQIVGAKMAKAAVDDAAGDAVTDGDNRDDYCYRQGASDDGGGAEPVRSACVMMIYLLQPICSNSLPLMQIQMMHLNVAGLFFKNNIINYNAL